MNLFESYAAELRDLNAAIESTFACRQDGGRQWNAWKEAYRRFHSSYDSPAFPGIRATGCYSCRVIKFDSVEARALGSGTSEVLAETDAVDQRGTRLPTERNRPVVSVREVWRHAVSSSLLA